MIHENIEFHNVVELERSAAGLCLRRFPAVVRTDPDFDAHGAEVVRFAASCEIRFVTDSPDVTIRLSREDGAAGSVMACKGIFIHNEYPLDAGQVTSITLSDPPNIGYSRPEALAGAAFSPRVWRIYSGSQPLVFHGLEARGHGVRPPAPQEKPRVRWLAYGSSITMNGPIYMNYVNFTSQLLKVDALNLGMAGACFMQKVVADHIAERQDWDFATLELGVNMRGEFEPAEFEKRARYMVARMLAAQPGKPVFVLTAFSNHNYFANEKNIWTDHQFAYNDALRAICRGSGSPQLRLLEGTAISSDFTGYRSDLLHPAGLATYRIAQNLADSMAPVLHAAGLRV